MAILTGDEIIEIATRLEDSGGAFNTAGEWIGTEEFHPPPVRTRLRILKEGKQ